MASLQKVALSSIIFSTGLPTSPETRASERSQPTTSAIEAIPHDDLSTAPTTQGICQEDMKRLKTCSHQGDFVAVEEAVEQLVAQNIPLDVHIMNTLVHACCKARKAKKAEQYLQMMDGLGLVANEVTFNLIINACAVVGKVDRARFWYELMLSHDLSPTEVTYGALCKAFGSCGDTDRVEQLLSDFVEAGGRLNEYHFASLISACGRAQPPDVSRAERALEELVRLGLRPDRVRRVFFRVAGESRAGEIFAWLSQSGASRRPVNPKKTSKNRRSVMCETHARSILEESGGEAGGQPHAFGSTVDNMITLGEYKGNASFALDGGMALDIEDRGVTSFRDEAFAFQ